MNIAVYEYACVRALVGASLFVSMCMLVRPCLYMHSYCCFSIEVCVNMFWCVCFGVLVLMHVYFRVYFWAFMQVYAF